MTPKRDTLWLLFALTALLAASHLVSVTIAPDAAWVRVCAAAGALVGLAGLFSLLAVRLTSLARGLWAALAVAALACFALLWSDLPAHLPLVGGLWQGGGLSAVILGALLVVTWWCLVLVDQRRHGTAAEAKIVARVRGMLRLEGEERDRRRLLDALEDVDPRHGGFMRRRLRLLAGNAANLDQAAWLLAEEAGVDAARLQAAYGPLRALVWALPALGFIGTAAAMASSIAGVGGAMQEGAPAEAQIALLGRVVPHLADAFGITLIALASTIVCYFLLSLVAAREENVLLDTNTLALEALAKLQAARAPGEPADPTERLMAEMWSLQQEVGRLNGQLDRLLAGRGYSETLSAYLYAIVTQLRVLHETAASCPAGEPPVLNDIRTHLETLNRLLASQAPPASLAAGSNGAERSRKP
jgi:hypothetical protein